MSPGIHVKEDLSHARSCSNVCPAPFYTCVCVCMCECLRARVRICVCMYVYACMCVQTLAQ
eukprot:m.641851 g.641851  ORF g.641851 m.641851 type:complete len:61 (-) comp22632_c0_seq4:973-1155(-)